MSPRHKRRDLAVAVLGGTFDPIHNGHLAIARAARRRFRLDRIYFIPCGRPPHKHRPGLSPYLHRFVMVALVCAMEANFVPSLLEAGRDLRGRRRTYSIDTVRRLRRRLGPRTRIYFLLGADAFLYLATWKNYRQLVRLCDFIVAARPGFPWRRLQPVLAKVMEIRLGGGRRRPGPAARRRTKEESPVFFLPNVRANISATRIRRRVRRGRSAGEQVPPAVADYIEKVGLYRGGR